MGELLIVSFVSVIAIFLATSLFYECLCFLSRFIANSPGNHRTLMLTMVSGIFVAHAAAIFIYAVFYWGLTHYAGFADLSGNVEDHFLTYLYFSITSYSSLGIGDVFPVGSLRFLAGVEAINGLILITWSAAFTYFIVQEMWDAHNTKDKGD
ncbi:MAG: Ion channel family protein [Alphaproteobacteria bacterium]|nr:MAG: Ion channel family protein [Alphaproteobacteria bacterium]